MKKHSESGSILPVITIIILAALLIGTAIFAYATVNSRNQYKNESDRLSAIAVTAAKKQQAIDLQKKFDEDIKKPYKSFKGPIALGSINFQYPKTWSAYVDQSDNGQPINGYFYPDIIPGLQSGTAYALRVELVGDDYSQVLQQFDSQIKDGTVKASAYKPPKMVDVANVQVGTLLRGNITDDFQGIMVVIKVRDKTLQISTQTNTFAPDFTNIVLKNLTFNP